MAKGTICIDMDGTIANLYGVPNWLDYLRKEDPYPYIVARPLCDMFQLGKILTKLKDAGYEIRIISWLSKNASEEYKHAVRIAKRNWLQTHQVPYGVAHLIQYGTTKADCVRNCDHPCILVDDDSSIRDGWTLGRTIDPVKENIITALAGLLD